MHSQFRPRLLAAALALAGGSAVQAEPGTAQWVIDARQEAQIWTTYALNPYLRTHDLTVTAHAGKATLTGTVADEVSKELARQIALGVTGISEVDNQIAIEADAEVRQPTAERRYAQMLDDINITTAIRSKLAWNRHTAAAVTGVDTHDGKVTLQGTATSASTRELATRMATGTRGVVSVDNQLTVTDTPASDGGKARPAVEDSARDSGKLADSWITTKVKSTFMYSSNVDGSAISVTTNDGIVSLSGTLASGAERELVIELARNVRGVKDVHSTALVLSVAAR